MTPREVVDENFRRMGESDERHTVGELFAADVVVSLPGARFEGPNAPEEMVDHFDAQYEWCAKTFGRWYETETAVVSVGTLHGVDNAGESFEEVRYIDVYEVADGRITRLDVYNDLAEAGVVDYAQL